MSKECVACNEKWREIHFMSQQIFNKALLKAHIAILVLAVIAFISVLIAACCVVRTQRFIAKFEYVEETVVSQDGDGANVAVIGDNNQIGKG